MSLLSFFTLRDVLLDVLDIALVSVILYRLLLFIKGTKAAKILTGLLFILFASALANVLGLYTLDWLLSGFWVYIVIALIVIFQPEIRRTLAKVGETSLLAGLTSAEELKSLEEIVRASISLANRNIGAIVIIQRESELRDFVELGTQLDARVSKEILLSIFHPSSPIHDGAVIIKGNRIIAAGCFLPMVQQPSLSKSFGTRHRAALGLTEETDAVAVVVSEETGNVSLAVGNSLETRMDMGTLRDRLNDLFTVKEGAPK